MKEDTMNHEARLFHLKVVDGTLHARLGIGSISSDRVVDVAQASMEFAASCGAEEVIVSLTDLQAEDVEASDEAGEVTHAMGFHLPKQSDDEDEDLDDEDDE